MKITVVRGRAIDPTVNKMAQALSRNGHEVNLLVWDRENTFKNKNADGYTLYRFNLKAPYDTPSVLFYLPLWLAYQFYFHLRYDSDLIHACDLDTLIPALPVMLVKRIKLCYTIYDFYADNLPKQVPSLVRKFVAFVEKFGIRFAGALFLVNELQNEQIRGAKINNLVYIYNSPPDYFDAKRIQSSSAGAEITIFYAGVIHNSRGLEYMIRAVEDLNNVRLIIAGRGSENLLHKITEKVRCTGWIPYEEVIDKTIESDILFAFYDPKIPNNRYASPNKLFEAMMCGKPIIVNDRTVMSEIVRAEKCGIAVPYGDVEAIREAIVKLKNNPELCQELGENGRKAYEERYNWQDMEKRLLDAYDRLKKRNGI
ncbi:glycosyltransferase family 4 protein [Dehalococcoidia bacterium]|nr:glycosyltransferase family 4 protein [Dehalococcoidia bacterium]